MQRNVGIYLLSALMLLPLGWLLATARASGARATILMGGGLAISGALVFLAFRMHGNGKLLPNHCKTCGRAMARLKAGELRPPAGARNVDKLRWRCGHCGRLA